MANSPWTDLATRSYAIAARVGHGKYPAFIFFPSFFTVTAHLPRNLDTPLNPVCEIVTRFVQFCPHVAALKFPGALLSLFRSMWSITAIGGDPVNIVHTIL